MPSMNDLVKSCTSQDLTDEQVEELLWNCTPFPAGSIEQISEMLRTYWLKSGGDYAKCMELADQDFTEAASWQTKEVDDDAGSTDLE